VSKFFIRRPVLAWVIAIIIMLLGVVAITRLPIARYPNMAPPSVQVSASYPGASARTVEDAVTQIVEQNMAGIDGLLYISSTSSSDGSASITLTFANGTNPDTAQVQVQNRLQQAVPLLPQIVQQQGIVVSKSAPSYFEVISFVSSDGRLAPGDIGDFLATNVIDPLSRVTGVGSVDEFGSRYAMRIWLDAGKLNTYGLTPADVTAAIRAQNSQISLGQLGDLPAVPGQQLNATISALGRMNTPEQFRTIVLRSNSDGSTLRLQDVARVELGQADYLTSATYNGKPAAGLGITLASGANALATSQAVAALLERLQPQFPAGVSVHIPYDASSFVRKSISQVVRTLGEAILLVFLVMLVFLQDLRATLIPTIAVPVVLLGTFAVLEAAGLSINMLTMFAMVLAIGLLVDDAIVVVENVERLMHEEALSAVEATERSMEQITGALVGIATVLSAVFIPMAFLRGGTGVVYRQFSISIVSAMALSVLVATVLTPALCATLLKPRSSPVKRSGYGLLGRFNQGFDSACGRYQAAVAHMLARPVRYMLLYLALASIMGLLFFRLPTAFLPAEDEGYLFALVQAPVGATQSRTLQAMEQVNDYFARREADAVASTFLIAGFNFNGKGQGAGFGAIELKDWSERTSERLSAAAIEARSHEVLSRIRDAQAFALAPPPDVDLGNTAGFDFYLEDNNGQGHQALAAARDRLLGLAARDRLLANVRSGGQDDAPQFHLDIDPQKAVSFGLSMSDVEETLSIAWAGRYIDDFIDRGRVKRVIMQADAPFRMVPENFGSWYVRSSRGDMVSMSSIASSRWEYAPPQLQRYNGFSAMEINGEAAPGVSSGEAMKEVEKLVGQLPAGFTADFTGQSYEELSTGAQTPTLYTMAIIMVFLCLAALYESWSIPTAIILAVPLGVAGAVIATSLRGLERDVYFQIAMLTTVGLTSKNAILIVEFARQNVLHGMPLIDAILRAVRDRVRPIVMTSLAFGIGVLPLAVATGAGAGAQRSIGTGVFGGMLAATFLGVFFVPLFFLVVQRTLHGVPTQPGTGTGAVLISRQ
jgi:multidrug efflux pump